MNQGDTVTLLIDSNEHGSFHLHGYDIEKDIGPDATAELAFAADVTGRFNITFHPRGDHDDESGHGGLFESPTLLEGETFNFQVPDDPNQEPIPFHNHMHHEQQGLITIVESTTLSGRVEIQIMDDVLSSLGLLC